MPGHVDERLLEWATPRQAEFVRAVNRLGSETKAARELGVSRTTVKGLMVRLRRKAARSGYAPEHDLKNPAAPGFTVKGTSTLYGPDGDVKAQWVKTREDDQARSDAIREALEGFADPFRGLSDAPFCASPDTSADTLPAIVIGDMHLGMLAWGAETGEDFDIKIAESLMCGAVDGLVSMSPPSDQAMIVSVGDFLHADGAVPKTPQSGNSLDVDSRYVKVLHVAVRAMRRCVESTLAKHKTVRVIMTPGNHDPTSSLVLSIALANYFANDPRVKIDESPGYYRYHRFGECLFGVTHHDRIKPAMLPGVMACDRKEDWGQTTHRYWFTGHLHQRIVHELPGCVVETFRTLASKDAWHAAQGYRSGRDMTCIVYHREHGEIARHTMNPSRIQAIRSANP